MENKIGVEYSVRLLAPIRPFEDRDKQKRHLLPELNDRRGGVLMVIDGAIPSLKFHTRILNERKDRETFNPVKKIRAFSEVSKLHTGERNNATTEAEEWKRDSRSLQMKYNEKWMERGKNIPIF